MKLVALFLFSFCVGCTVYKSDSREAIEKNTKGIVTSTGFDPYQNISYTCFLSATAPARLNSPLEVLESEFESQGFSSLLISKDLVDQILIYRHETETSTHHYCLLSLYGHPKSNTNAIRLGVNLLLDQASGPRP